MGTEGQAVQGDLLTKELDQSHIVHTEEIYNRTNELIHNLSAQAAEHQSIPETLGFDKTLGVVETTLLPRMADALVRQPELMSDRHFFAAFAMLSGFVDGMKTMRNVMQSTSHQAISSIEKNTRENQ